MGRAASNRVVDRRVVGWKALVDWRRRDTLLKSSLIRELGLWTILKTVTLDVGRSYVRHNDGIILSELRRIRIVVEHCQDDSDKESKNV